MEKKKTEQSVLNYISRKGLLIENDRVLCAFSGGADSVFLLVFLSKFSRKFRIEVAACHLNHLLRKKAAFEDEEFCRNFCLERNIPFFSSRVDIKSVSREEGISVEEAGRNIRYSFLEQTAEEQGYSRIATGHNMDDNAETILLNLIKGSGIKGISGIPPRRGKIIRPLLNTSKEEILVYLQGEKIAYLTDRSNLKNDYERNYLRNRVIPGIKKRLNPSLNEAIFRSSEIFRDISAYIEKKASEAEKQILEQGENLRISVAELSKFERELHPEILKNVIERNFRSELSFKDIHSVLSLMDKTSGKIVNIPGKIKAVRERDYIIFYNEQHSSETRKRIKTGDHSKIDGKTLIIERWSGKAELTDNPDIEFISGDNLGNDFIVRQWQPGDKFSPIGMKGNVKVSDFLNALKIPSFEKKRKLVLTDGKEIIWVIGYRINEKFKLQPDTKKVIKLCLR
jgi:tRNA(Ile)-lysidine synthase